MKQTAYIRVSTQAQSYDRQLFTFQEYFKNRGIDPKSVKYISEKVTSYSSFKDREIYKLLNNSKQGDIIYACQLDRFGRTVQDVLDLVDFAMEKGVELITLDGHTIENKTPLGRMMLTMLAAFAEMERTLRAERCQAGLDAMKQEIEENGFRIARCSGKVQTRIGQEKGYDMSAAVQASHVAATAKKIAWRENSPAFQWVIAKLRDGWARKQIIEEFNKMHELQPEVFCTPKGKKLTKGLLSYWISDSGFACSK